jgi:hypothetical protein
MEGCLQPLDAVCNRFDEEPYSPGKVEQENVYQQADMESV